MPFIQDAGAPDGLPVVPLYVNGSPHPVDKDRLFPIVNSVENKTIHYAVSADPDSATRACDAASEAFKSWRKTSPAHRRSLLLKAADVLDRRREEIMDWQVRETSCPKEFAAFNIMAGAMYAREIAAATSEIRGTVSQRLSKPDGEEIGGLTIVVREPVGVVLIIPPWNGAVILPVRAISMALAAGCAIVVKASELCPRLHSVLVECFEEAGIPKGVLNIIQAKREDAVQVVESIVSHKAIRKVDFIGSAAVGSKIGQVCAKYLKPILMELGGKGPAIILEDADLQKAAQLCAMGAVADHGQLCFSTERIIVHKSVYDRFVAILTAIFSKIPAAGDSVTRQSATHAYDVLVDAQEKGAKFLVGGPEYIRPTSLKPTLVTNVSRDARIWDEETFGPSASVYIAEDDDDAIAKANDSAYGLNAAVHSTSWEHAYNVSKQLEYGQVHINNMTPSDSPGAPIRGVKGSGWGQSNSIWGIHEFSIEKTLSFHPSEVNPLIMPS
ncbi:aldehyde dehydrogenase [Aaosphaeria arxii CBS 175.79]|uniref:Aldehyde dehydrogenase n=1 Tax=Aaosphaeria arxii CBS 175.79 TaxID=1450172 RepID=A0A6A5XC52_9PLEO|nr:aldehyde dehydrogenase [Aaosphaeria arxii CBS 175.79]KAF2010489.1 aldehyde dehydrogenase [Aaosphaeria arxii CBS 175.79]